MTATVELLDNRDCSRGWFCRRCGERARNDLRRQEKHRQAIVRRTCHDRTDPARSPAKTKTKTCAHCKRRRPRLKTNGTQDLGIAVLGLSSCDAEIARLKTAT